MIKYAKIVCGALVVPQIYPGYIVLDGKKIYNPTDEQYRNAGYLPLEETPQPETSPELPDLLPEEQQYLEQSSTPEPTQADSVILEIPVQSTNTAVGNATSNGANIDLQIESGQF